MPVSSDNQETSTSSSLPTTTIQIDTDKKPTTEDDSVVTTTRISSGNDADHIKKNTIHLEEIYAKPGDILVVAEQRRFRFPYRRRFAQKQKEDDEGFPALF